MSTDSSRGPEEPVKLRVYQNFLHANTTQYEALNTVNIQTVICDETGVTRGAVNAVKGTNKPLGCSVGLHPKDQTISAIAISNSGNRCLVVEFTTQLGLRATGRRGSRTAFDLVRAMIEDVLCLPTSFYAFDLAPLALALYRELNIRITDGVDIQSAFPGSRKTSLEAILAIIGDDAGIRVDKDHIISAFEDLSYDPKLSSNRTALIQRAWISQFIAGYENAPEQFDATRHIDTTTKTFSNEKLDILSKWAADSVRLQYMKPLETEHTVMVGPGSNEAGGFHARSVVYKNRLRPDKNVQLSLQNEHGTFNVSAHTGTIDGRKVELNLPREIGSSNHLVGKVTSKGRDGPTRADQNKALVVLKILQGQQVLFDDPWVKNLWFPPNGIMTWSDSQVSTHVVTVPETPQRPLNTSQIYAIEKMLSFKTEDHIILLRGPPGSGKTSVISRFVEIATASEHYPGIWLIAQSNIAVKNIAEKLVSVGYMKWRLLVSKDFIFDWHEHLYDAKFRDNVISSEKFFALSMSKISDSKVILCTLSMFSNFFISKFTKHIPIHTLIVDEASQIEVGSFLSVLISASKTLQKLCLIGDDKQLPPYGQEEIQDLKSVFEIDHLQNHLYLLDTQYRMPPQMGDFISNTVYNGELKSNSKHAINDKTIACQFIDAGGVERSERDSYINTTEASAVIKLAAFLQTSGKSYRIVTPYDSQRNRIEELMKGQGLSWHDKCFNVDSFQGNEDNFIIISIVRSHKSGFLTNLRRTNVMLTRFKRGMFIVTSKKFITGPGAGTLVSELADYYEKRVGDAAWLRVEDIGSGKIVLN